MPPKKRKNSVGPPTLSKKAKTASHTATNSVNTNGPAILALTDNTSHRAARRPVVDTPGLYGNQSQVVHEANPQITRQFGNDIETQISRQIVHYFK
ncbi:hypothetical protein DPMN_165077 [Dreissena polymorpha]|uniref:Uncharacterized protein n=1 Tax=Dreissena polymorpha TaxID=45954 RepID=A0A9D4EWF8_DREPO|nr:hypothetical protein DPMN_165077 [Dreissena polymorpha]